MRSEIETASMSLVLAMTLCRRRIVDVSDIFVQ